MFKLILTYCWTPGYGGKDRRIRICPSFLPSVRPSVHPSVLLSGSFLGIGALAFFWNFVWFWGPIWRCASESDFFLKIPFWQKWPKMVEDDPKLGLRDFLGKSIHWFCLEMMQNESTYDLLAFCQNRIFGKNLVLKLWPKMLLANQHFQYSLIVNISLMDWHLILFFFLHADRHDWTQHGLSEKNIFWSKRAILTLKMDLF